MYIFKEHIYDTARYYHNGEKERIWENAIE